MFDNLGILLESWNTPLWLAAVPAGQPMNSPEVVIFSGTQFFVAIIAGLLIALAIQFLSTSLTIATGISTEGEPLEAEAAETWGSKVREFESKIGVWALITVNLALFIASFLAVKLTLINNAGLGAITGVVIWSAFFLVLLWLSSKAVNSLVGSVVNTAASSSSLQGIMAIATTAFGGWSVNAQIAKTVGESVASVSRELSSAVDPGAIKDQLQGYLKQLQPPKLDLQGIGNNFEKLLNNSDIKSIADSNVLKNIDQQSFVDLVSSRTDLSKQEISQVADQLKNSWQQVVGQNQTNSLEGLKDFLQTATPDELKPQQLGQKLDQVVKETQNKQGSGQGPQAIAGGVSGLFSTVLNRTDLSDLNVEQVVNQLQKLKDQVTDRAKQVGENIPTPQQNTIKNDVENYLLQSKPWHLNRETIKQEFREVIYDPEANPGLVRRQLEALNRDSIVKVLNQRDQFSSDKVNEIADQLEGIRQEVLQQVQGTESEEQSQNIRSQVENYFRSTGKEEFNPEGIEQNFKQLLADPEAGVEQLGDRLSQFDRDTLTQMLREARQDISEEDANNIVNQLESVRDRVLSEAQDLQTQAKSQGEELGQKVESYLRDTNKEELKPEGIKQDLQTLLNEPKAGAKALRERLSQFDRDTLVKLLSERGDLSEEEINHFIDRFNQVRDNILQAPQKLAGKAKDQTEQVTSKIADYLRNTNKEELNPDGIKQDLTSLFNDPQQGAVALRDRLSHVDRDTLVKLLSQREDLSEEQVNQIVDNVQETIRSIVKAPRRLASRAVNRVQSWESQLEDYLRHTNKEELNPDGIKQELQLLLQQPGSGLEQIRDRLSHFDRDTFVSLLSQREDISEEEANQIADRIASIPHQVIEQAQKVQDKAQSAIDNVFAQIRNYLNSLERPELNYEGIQQDVQQLFKDPEAGWEAVSDRLSQFDRDTVVALVSSNDRISEADANQLIDKIEHVRDTILSSGERIQQQAEERINQIKQDAKQQVKEAQKVAATAAWWLFGTALTSVGVAALAGFMAVRGLNVFG